MPPGLHPPPPGLDEKGVVESQGDYGCPANGRQTDNVHTVAAPDKMLVPILSTWIEQWDGLASQGVGGVSACSFVAVA